MRSGKMEEVKLIKLDRKILRDLEMIDDRLVLVLKGHLYIENELKELIKRYVINTDVVKSLNPNFKSKVNFAFSLNLIDEKYFRAISTFNKFRNEYAHNLDYEITDENIRDFKRQISNIEGLEIFSQSEIFTELNTPTNDLKAILIGLYMVLAVKVGGIQKANNPVYSILKKMDD